MGKGNLIPVLNQYEMFEYIKNIETILEYAPTWYDAPPGFKQFLAPMLRLDPRNRRTIFNIQLDPFLTGVDRTRIPLIDLVPCTQRYLSKVSMRLSLPPFNIEGLNKGLYTIWALNTHIKGATTEKFLFSSTIFLYYHDVKGIAPEDIDKVAYASAYIGFKFIEGSGLLTIKVFKEMRLRNTYINQVLDYAVDILESIDFDLLVATPYDSFISYLKENEFKLGLKKEDVRIAEQFLFIATLDIERLSDPDLPSACVRLIGYLKTGKPKYYDKNLVAILKSADIPENLKNLVTPEVRTIIRELKL